MTREKPLAREVDVEQKADAAQSPAEELERIRQRLAELERGQKLGLVWRDIPEDVETKLRDEVPVLVHEKELDVSGANPSDSPHILIEGDNLHALHVLQATHKGRVDVIYIDPPYNTKNKEFIYNDTRIDEEYTWRHSAWLSFMSKRLTLARDLLSSSGLILISIDDHESARLQLLADSIFGEANRMGPLVWFYEGVSDNQAFIKKTHEYVLIYRKSSDVRLSTNVRDPNVSLAEVIENSVVKNGPKNPPSSVLLPVGFPADLKSGTIKKTNVASLTVDRDYEIANHQLRKEVRVTSGWSSKDILQKFIDSGFQPIRDSKGQRTTFSITRAGNIVYRKERDQSHVLSVTRNLGTTANAGAELDAMGVHFDFPKPVGLIKYLLSFSPDKNSVVLDFFAGSGTTLHATASLNAEDGGTRTCILVSNNEKEVQICREVTQPRCKAVLTGQWADGTHDPLPGSLVFFRTDFAKRLKSPDRMRTEIARHTVDLVAVKESTARTVSRNATLAVLKGAAKTVAVVPGLDPDHAELRKAAEKKVEDGDKKIVYLFTWSDHGVEEEVAALWPGWEVNPLPAEMLAALRRLAPPARLFDDLGGVS
jgi:adenine-specific DNA-methyltransferase